MGWLSGLLRINKTSDNLLHLHPVSFPHGSRPCHGDWVYVLQWTSGLCHQEVNSKVWPALINRSQGRGHAKIDPQNPNEKVQKRQSILLGLDIPGPKPRARPGAGIHRSPVQPRSATWGHLVGLPLAKWKVGVRWNASWVSSMWWTALDWLDLWYGSLHWEHGMSLHWWGKRPS